MAINQYGFIPPFLNPFEGDTGTGGTEGLVPAPAAGDGPAGKFLNAQGEWSIPSGTGGGVTGIGTFDSQTPAANALTISGTSIYAQSASTTVPGMVNIGSQNFSGLKGFNSLIRIYASSNQLILGATNTTTYTSDILTNNRIFSTPDADSNSIVPLGSATANNWVTHISSNGVQHLLQPTFSNISGTVDLATQVSGILAIANGGTGLNSAGTGNQLLGVNSGATGLEYKTLSTGTSGADFNIAYSSGAVTLNLPDAGTSIRGAVNTGSQSFAGAKTLLAALTIALTTNQIALGTTNKTTVTMASLSANRTFTLPDANSNTIQPLSSATSSNWVTYVSSDGVQHLAQPTFADISGTVLPSQLPTPTTTTLGGIKSYAAVTNQWIYSIDTSGNPLSSQPSFSNISGLLDLQTQVTDVLHVANGGTDLNATPTNGQIPIGNGFNYTLSTLTAGSGITITNAPGSIIISAAAVGSVSSITGTTNQILANGTFGTPQTGAVTLTTPQDIGTGSSVTFASLNLSGLTASQAVVTDGSKNLASLAYSATGGINNLISRDANGNSFANNFTSGTTSVNAAGGSTNLNPNATRKQILIGGSSGQTFKLPNATQLNLGTTYDFNNNSTGNLTINDNSNALVTTVLSGGYKQIFVTDISTPAGVWDYHSFIPANSYWSSNNFGMGTTAFNSVMYLGTTATVNNMGFNNAITLSNNSNATNLVGLWNEPTINSGAASSSHYGMINNPVFNATGGSMTTAYGASLGAVVSSGTVTNLITLQVLLGSGGSNNICAVFGGSVNIGSSYLSTVPPANSLIVQSKIGINDTSPSANLSIVGNAAIGYSSGTSVPSNCLAVSGGFSVGAANSWTTTDYTMVMTQTSKFGFLMQGLITTSDGTNQSTLLCQPNFNPGTSTLGISAGIWSAPIYTLGAGVNIPIAASIYIQTSAPTLGSGASITKGIGLYVDTIYNGSTAYGIYAKKPNSSAATYNMSAYFDDVVSIGSSTPTASLYISSTSPVNYSGIYNGTTLSNNSNAINLVGFWNAPTINSGAATSSHYGMINNPTFNAASGSITNGYGSSFGAIATGGTVTNLFSLRVLLPSGATNNICAVFGGSVNIGSSYLSTVPPANSLIVQGKTGFGTSSINSDYINHFFASSVAGDIIGINGTLSVNNSNNNQIGILVNNVYSPPSNANSILGVFSAPTFAVPTGITATIAAAFYANNYFNGNIGFITGAYGLYIDTGSSAAGVITTAYGLYCRQQITGSSNICAAFEDGISIGASYNTTVPPTGGAIIKGQVSIGVSTFNTAGMQLGGSCPVNYSGIYAAQTLSNNTSGANVVGFYNTPTINSGAASSTHFGMINNPTFNGTSSITTAYGSQFNTACTGTVSTAYTMYVTTPTGASTNVCAYFQGPIKIGTNSTGSGTPALGSNCPATTLTAPYTWLKFYSNDGSSVWVAAYK